MYKTTNAVVLFIFIRLESTLNIIDQLRKVQPPRLYIVGEGYRNDKPGEKEVVAEVRRQVKSAIDWDCAIHEHYVEEDIGAGRRISSGISWVFEHEKQAIFIEDDIIPSLSFFRFCDEMLSHYEHDTQVMVISGNNVITDYKMDASYTFSSIPFIWGWATWKRAWEQYDYDIKSWPIVKKKGELKHKFSHKLYYDSRANEFDLAYQGIEYTWDYQFAYHLLINSGLCVVPHKNLIQNVGVGLNATNTTSTDYTFHNVAEELDFPIKHPSKVQWDQGFDDDYYRHFLFKAYYSSCLIRFNYTIRKMIGKKATAWLRSLKKRQ